MYALFKNNKFVKICPAMLLDEYINDKNYMHYRLRPEQSSHGVNHDDYYYDLNIEGKLIVMPKSSYWEKIYRDTLDAEKRHYDALVKQLVGMTFTQRLIALFRGYR
jgi:hypothetical protein